MGLEDEKEEERESENDKEDDESQSLLAKLVNEKENEDDEEDNENLSGLAKLAKQKENEKGNEYGSMPHKLRRLQQELERCEFNFLSEGVYDIADDIYPAVEEQYPGLCLDIRCDQVCSSGTTQLEWHHRVQTVLCNADDESRIESMDKRGLYRLH